VLRRSIASFTVVAAFHVLVQPGAGAHAALRLAYPLEGATLGDTPPVVQLSFWEKPEPALSIIRVVDSTGAFYELGRPSPVAGDPLSMAVAVRPLDTGVYQVNWRVVSAVDGHATAGVYAFGIRVLPTGPSGNPISTYPPASPVEVVGRWMFLVGLAGLLGAASAGIARFGGARELGMGTATWMIASVGLLLLADAQRRLAGVSFAELSNTVIGRALIWRGVSVASAGAALLLARWSGGRLRRVVLAGVAIAVIAAITVHVGAGHAAAGRWPLAATVGVQSVHFAAVGVWLGGLAALLLGVRKAPASIRIAAVRRFSTIAAAALFVVLGTGIVRAIAELASWRALTSTVYGRLLSAKMALLLIIASFGAVNRWRSVNAAATDLGPLRRASGGELITALVALAVTAMLSTLPPPAASPQLAPIGITVSGTDFARSVRVDLTTGSDQPGPNRFVVRVIDYDSKAPVRAERVNLQFRPLDDPGVESTSLVLTAGPGDTYVGSGANMSFDGRWHLTVTVERGGDSVDVPLEVETQIPPRWVSVQRRPGQAPIYTVEMRNQGVVHFSPDPERAGRSRLQLSCFDFVGELKAVDSMVVTAATDGAPRQLPVERVNSGEFVADIEFQPGPNTVTVVARASDGMRMRAKIVIDIPRR
jgi:copper transport protein